MATGEMKRRQGGRPAPQNEEVAGLETCTTEMKRRQGGRPAPQGGNPRPRRGVRTARLTTGTGVGGRSLTVAARPPGGACWVVGPARLVQNRN